MGILTEGKPIDPAVFKIDWDAYYDALGRFMHQFAHTEDELNRIIKDFVVKVLKLTPSNQIIAAIVGGMRIAASRDMLKRLLRVTRKSQEVKDKVDHVLAQLGEIHYMRDRIAHNESYPSLAKAGNFETTNQMQIRETEQMDWISFNPQILLDMAADLERIPYLIEITLASAAERERHATMAKTVGDRQQVLDPRSRPWRYKPSQLEKTGPKHERTPQPRGHQTLTISRVILICFVPMARS